MEWTSDFEVVTFLANTRGQHMLVRRGFLLLSEMFDGWTIEERQPQTSNPYGLGFFFIRHACGFQTAIPREVYDTMWQEGEESWLRRLCRFAKNLELMKADFLQRQEDAKKRGREENECFTP